LARSASARRGGCRTRGDRQRREIELKAVAEAPHLERSNRRREGDGLSARLETVEHDPGGGKRAVAAHRLLDKRV